MSFLFKAEMLIFIIVERERKRRGEEKEKKRKLLSQNAINLVLLCPPKRIV
jgi:hypothetical protein